MSSFLCFVCHSTVNEDTNEETRDKYREVIGMNLCPDSHLCYICCYFLNKMCMFKSICLKRSLEYPVLFSEKGTINLQRSLTTVSILCPEDICLQHLNTYYHFYNTNENSQSDCDDNNYCELQDDRNFDLSDNFLKTGPIENFHNEDYLFVTKEHVVDNLFNEELMIPNLEPVRITQNDLVNGKWTENVHKSDKYRNSSFFELHNYRNSMDDRNMCPTLETHNPQISTLVHNDVQENLNTISNSTSELLYTMNDKNYHDLGTDIAHNFKHIQQPNLIYNTNHCYGHEHIQNHMNENLQSNMYNNRHVSNVCLEPNLNHSINNLTQTETHMNVPVSTINQSVCEVNEFTHRSSCALTSNVPENKQSLPILNETVAINEPESKLNDGTVLNDTTTELSENETCKEENENLNNKEVDSAIDETKPEITESEDNIDESMSDTSEGTIKDLDVPADDNFSENENQSDKAESCNDDKVEVEKKSKSKKHKNKSPFRKIFLSIEEQKAELESARKDERYLAAAFKCHSCAAYFHFKDTYQAHMMRHEESNGEHCCSVCSLRFANPAVLRSHAANHSVRYRCRVCSELVGARRRQTHAIHCAGKRDSVTCHLCGKIFTCSQYFQRHLQRYHGSENKQYLCNVCGKSFSSRARVRTHMITHMNRKFTCDECAATFSSPYTLNQHRKVKHLTLEPQVHCCNSCNVSYTSRKSLLAHYRNALAHKESVYKCNICGRSCPTAQSLARHTACVHTRSKHIACSLCHKRYSTQKALVRHMTTNHDDGRAVPLCHSCGITFKNASVLKKHLKNVCEKDKKCQSSLEDELLQVPYYE